MDASICIVVCLIIAGMSCYAGYRIGVVKCAIGFNLFCEECVKKGFATSAQLRIALLKVGKDIQFK